MLFLVLSPSYFISICQILLLSKLWSCILHIQSVPPSPSHDSSSNSPSTAFRYSSVACPSTCVCYLWFHPRIIREVSSTNPRMSFTLFSHDPALEEVWREKEEIYIQNSGRIAVYWDRNRWTWEILEQLLQAPTIFLAVQMPSNLKSDRWNSGPGLSVPL